ncbi:MAG: SDR family oxidoreductase [Rhodocyclales bacterium]|nr:SDR family oxidoreductase [Rhodocyclales bacterium]
MKLLDEKVGIVTGAGGGIGRCVALALTAAGAAVVVSDIRQAAADETVALIRQAGGEAIAVVGDISEEADWVRLVAATIERFGAVDILVNNAAAASFKDRDILSMDVAVWDAAMRINLRGPMLGCKHVLAAMLQQGGGAIINIASGAALTGQLSQPAYGAAKAATISLTRSVATLYGKQGIRCNAIAPGLIMHEGLAAFFPEEHIRIDSDNLLTPSPGKPEDIANVVVFLASPNSGFINAQVLSVDGGLLAHTPGYAQARALGLGSVGYVGKPKAES